MAGPEPVPPSRPMYASIASPGVVQSLYQRSSFWLQCETTPISSKAVQVMALEIKILRRDDKHVLDEIANCVFDRPVDAALTSEFLCDPRHHLSVGIEDGVVVGFASAVHYIHPDKPPQLWINEVGVSPSHLRKGVATRVLNALLSVGRELGCTEAWVLTSETNAAARALYRSIGGVEAPQIMVSFSLGREPDLPK